MIEYKIIILINHFNFMSFELTTTEQDKKVWYYFQRLVQYGYFVIITTYYLVGQLGLFCYRSNDIFRRNYTGFCTSFSWDDVFGFVIIGFLILYWHKHTKKPN